MTKDEIDDLMRDNGIVVVGEAVYALCQLVAAAEREDCARILDEMAEQMVADMEPSSAIAWIRNRAAAFRARAWSFT